MIIIGELGPPAGETSLSCEESNRFIVELLEETMDDAMRVRFEAPLRHCPNCDAFLEQYRETAHPVRDLGTLELPEEVVRRTIDILKHRYRA